jgi:hypothetical protein
MRLPEQEMPSCASGAGFSRKILLLITLMELCTKANLTIEEHGSEIRAIGTFDANICHPFYCEFAGVQVASN